MIQKVKINSYQKNRKYYYKKFIKKMKKKFSNVNNKLNKINKINHKIFNSSMNKQKQKIKILSNKLKS